MQLLKEAGHSPLELAESKQVLTYRLLPHLQGRLPVKWMAPEALFDRVYTHQSDV